MLLRISELRVTPKLGSPLSVFNCSWKVSRLFRGCFVLCQDVIQPLQTVPKSFKAIMRQFVVLQEYSRQLQRRSRLFLARANLSWFGLPKAIPRPFRFLPVPCYKIFGVLRPILNCLGWFSLFNFTLGCFGLCPRPSHLSQ